jgi:hypothetical protein
VDNSDHGDSTGAPGHRGSPGGPGNHGRGIGPELCSGGVLGREDASTHPGPAGQSPERAAARRLSGARVSALRGRWPSAPRRRGKAPAERPQRAGQTRERPSLAPARPRSGSRFRGHVTRRGRMFVPRTGAVANGKLVRRHLCCGQSVFVEDDP